MKGQLEYVASRGTIPPLRPEGNRRNFVGFEEKHIIGSGKLEILGEGSTAFLNMLAQPRNEKLMDKDFASLQMQLGSLSLFVEPSSNSS